MAGLAIKAGHFPFVIGRSSQADCRLEEPGVWERHAELALRQDDVFQITLQAGAKGSVNGQPFESVALRNGDTLDFGGVKLQFFLGETVLRDWRWRERLLWAFLGIIVFCQILLFYWMS